jgi:hypothetical protein
MASKVYAIDFSSRNDGEAPVNFLNDRNPTDEQFQTDLDKAFEQAYTSTRPGTSARQSLLQNLAEAGYIRVETVTYVQDLGEIC